MKFSVPSVIITALAALLTACEPQVVHEVVDSTQENCPFYDHEYEALKDCVMLAEVRLETERLNVYPHSKGTLKYRAVVERCLKGNLPKGARLIVVMTVDATPYAVANDILEGRSNNHYEREIRHHGRRAWVYASSDRQLVPLAGGFCLDDSVNYTPVFWGKAADAAVDALFSQSIDTK